MKKNLALLALALALTACSGAPKPPAPGVKVGKPYSINGETYYPEYDPHYDRTGTASWYGPGFHGKPTANGERFDQEELTAAHPTLPMPSLVRVTNLQNGRSEIIRVNDRGPFKSNRLIDLSSASAKALGVSGLAKVRVQYLKEETEQYWAEMHVPKADIAFAANDPYAPDEAAEAGRGGLDGQQIAADAEVAPQVKSAAPITSVARTELDPQEMKFRPIAPRFFIIGEAEAAEPQTVHLTDTRGKPAGLRAPQPEAEEERIDTSSEAFESKDSAPEEASPSAGKAPASASEGGQWFIQAGSFSSEANAKKLSARLKNIAAVEQRPVAIGGQTWHRVRAGPFASRDKAERVLEKTVSEGATGAHIVHD